MTDTIVVYQVALNGDVGYVLREDELAVAVTDLEAMNEGDTLSLKKIRVPAEKMKNLPEFQGW